MPFGFTMPSASAAPAQPTTYRVALISNTTNDRREFNIHAGTSVTIGRASRSKGKTHEGQPDNALFDCPVVSRIHAELRATPLRPFDQQITITDRGSLHGTKVNGMPLERGHGFALKTGDVIKLGERVSRGDDFHEGHSLTFERLHTPSSYLFSSTADRIPQAISRGFRAPSYSDASDLDSDNMGSYASDGEHHSSSAKTTPEQNKMKIGTQLAPIALDADGVDSEEEDITFAQRVPESDVRPALDSFDSFSDAASLRDARYNDEDDRFLAEDGLSAVESDEDSDIDHIDDVEYDEDNDEDEDNLSNPASDISSEEDSDVDAEEPSYREPSPELGSFDDASEAMVEAMGEPIAFADLVDSAWNVTSPKQRYDPVRSSVPPRVEQAPEPIHHGGRTTTTPFTYGVPGYDVRPATNFAPSNHWDVQHPVFTSAYQPGSPGYRPTSPQPLFPMSINAIVEPLPETAVEPPAKTVAQAVAEAVVETAVETIVQPTAEPISQEVAQRASKRKRDEVDDAADVPQPLAKKATQGPPAPPARRRVAPKEYRSAIRKAVVGATQAAAFAAVGAVGTVAFLSSPMAESLIQWLG